MKKNKDLTLESFMMKKFTKAKLISLVFTLLEEMYYSDIETYAEIELYSNYIYEKYKPKNEEEIKQAFIEDFGSYNEDKDSSILNEIKTLIEINKGI